MKLNKQNNFDLIKESVKSFHEALKKDAFARGDYERKEKLENGDRMINNEIESILEERHEPLDEDDAGINMCGDRKE